MRKFALPAAAAIALASTGVALASGHSTEASGAKDHIERISVFAPTVQFKMIELGDSGFSLGDELVFSDDLLSSMHGHKVGFNGGVCSVVRVGDAMVGTGTLECALTFSLGAGQIVTEGLIQLTMGQLTGTQILPITGGTGRFHTSRGQAAFRFLSNTEAVVTFSIAR
jgi:hypothetical protein